MRSRSMYDVDYYVSRCGDISIEYRLNYYEYDSLTNRYYILIEGALSSEDGSLVKKRISKSYFEEIKSEALKALDEIESKKAATSGIKAIVIEDIPPAPEKPVRQLSDAEILTMLNNGRFDQDADLVRKQHREHENGHIHAIIQKNIYGWCLFDPYWGGKRISENFATQELAEEYTQKWVSEDPGKHHFCNS